MGAAKATEAPSLYSKIAQVVLLLLGFAMALAGLGNSMPAFGPLPRIGPFETEPYRALLFASGVIVCVLTAPMSGLIRRRRPALAPLGWLIDALIVAVALYALYRYFVIVKEVEEGLFFFETPHAWIALAGCLAIITMCWRIWGAPLAIVGLVSMFYFFTGPYWPGIFETATIDFVEDTAENLWFNNNDGVLGNIVGIVTSTIFPFILLGAMLEASGGGHSLIKISFVAMRRFRGGPAHAAILASGLFGTISGSAVANVVGTGVITIPMIKRRGFKPAFAGGVEATASTGGQIMPPIMGAAALVMADFTGIAYLTIIVCAIVPAFAYYLSLFVTVVFESRRLGVVAKEEDVADIEIARSDYVNLVLVVLPIFIVVAALIYGASPAGSAILALFCLIPLSFLNPDIRREPHRLLGALAKGGANMGRLLMAVGTVGIVVAVLGATGLPTDFATLVSGTADRFLVVTLILTAAAALVLGMGMPTLPAYLTIVIILGPSLQTLGLSELTSHMFVFYFGVASAITPPVAIAAYAAAAIAGAGAISTAVSAVRIGIVIFAIPFAFSLNPVMLVVAESGAAFSWGAFISIVLRLVLIIYLLASAASRFDGGRMTLPEAVLRFVAALALLAPAMVIHVPAAVLGVALILRHRIKKPEAGETAAPTAATEGGDG